MTQKIVGQRLTICFAEGEESDDNFGSLPSWIEAVSHLNPAKVDASHAQMFARLRRLANEASLRSPDQFRREGKLPDGKYFYAVKAGKIRGYGWYSVGYKGVFIISHFAFKQREKLDSADEKRVKNNWKAIERQKGERS